MFAAIRDAANLEQILERIEAEAGLRLQFLTGEEEAHLTYSAVRRWYGWQAGHLLNIDIRINLTLPSLLQLPLVLPGSTLAATLPERVAALYAEALPIRMLPLPFEVPHTQEVLLWHKRHESDPAHTWLREMIVKLTREN